MSISKRFTSLLLALIMAVSVFSFTALDASGVITDADFVAPVITIPDSMPTPDNNLMTNNVTYYLGAGTRWEQFVKADFLAAGKKGRGTYNYQKYIVVHNTGAYPSTSTSLANHNYGKTTDVDVSWHYTCGNDGIYQMIPVNEKGWHAGGNYWGTTDTAVKTSKGWISDCSNSTAVGIETATPGFPATDTFSGEKWDSDEMYDWYANTFDSTATYLAQLVAWLCVGMNFNPYTQVAQHYSAAAKNCPIQMRYVFGSGGKTFTFYGTYFKVMLDRMYDYYKAYGGSYVSTDTLKNTYYNPNTVSYKKGLYKSSSAVTVYRAGNTSTGAVGTVAANNVMDVQVVGFDWGKITLANGTSGWVKLSGLTYVGNTYRLGTYRTSSGSIVNVTNISGTTAYYDGGSTAISNLTKVYKVTVNGDTAFGSTPKYYAKGETFTISAAKSGNAVEFDMWETMEGLCSYASKTSSTTTVTVKDSDLVINPSYRGDYILTVTDGSGGGRFKGGNTAKISAFGKPGYEFAGWVIESGEGTIGDPTAVNTTFTIGTSDATVKPVYRPAGELDTTGVTNYALGKSYTSTWGGNSTISYYSTTQDDSSLKKLTDGVKPSANYSTADGCYASFLSSSKVGTFTINLGTSRNIRMVALCGIANNGGSFGDVVPGSVKVEYSTNGSSFTALTISDTILYSYSGGTALGNVYTHRLDFSPVNATHVRVTFTSATYCTSLAEIEVYGGENNGTLTVQNGTGSGTFSVGKITSIKATSPGADYEFKGWTIVSGKGYITDPSAESTTFTVAAGSTTIKANYVLKDEFALVDTITPPFKVDAGDAVIDGMPENNSVKNVKAAFKSSVTIKKPDGTVAADTDFVGTGYTVSGATKTVTVIVSGDLDSDASVSSSDYIVLKKFLTGKVTLNGAYKKASDCDGNANTDTADYITLAKKLKG